VPKPEPRTTAADSQRITWRVLDKYGINDASIKHGSTFTEVVIPWNSKLNTTQADMSAAADHLSSEMPDRTIYIHRQGYQTETRRPGSA
jgi:hypothetical protein